MNQLARRFRWKCWFMTWKQELGFLQYLPDTPVPSQLLLKLFSQHHSSTSGFSSWLNRAPLCTFQRSGIIQVTLGAGSPLKSKDLCSGRVCSTFFSFHSRLDVQNHHVSAWLHAVETNTVIQRDFGSRKEKASKTLHWALKCAKIYQALRMETCQGEAFLPQLEGGWSPQEGEGELFSKDPFPPLSKKHAMNTQQISVMVEQQDPLSLVPSTPPTVSPGAWFLRGSRGPEPG